MKRTLAAGSAAILLAMVVGCSSGANNDGGPVTIDYAIWDQSQEATFEAIAEAFTAENPDITINIQVTSTDQYWTKLSTQASNGTLPDVFWMNPFNFPLYASEDMILPLDEKVDESGFDVEAIPETMRSYYTANDALYALPNNRDAIVVYYNRDLFEASGVEVPDESWTWDDFGALAEDLTPADGSSWGTAAAVDFRGQILNTIYQAGGFVIDDDRQVGWTESGTREGVQYWVEMAQAGVSPTVSQLAENDQNSLFLSGRVAMLYAGTWMGLSFAASELGQAGSIGVLTVPHGPQGNATSTSSLGNVISAESDNVDAAYSWVEFLGGHEAAAIYAASGVALTAYPDTDAAFLQHFEGTLDANSMVAAIENTFRMPVSQNSSVWLSAITEELTPAYEGITGVDDATEQLQTFTTEALADETDG